MSKVTGKFQLTLPKRLVEDYGIKIGDEVDLVAAGDYISMVPASRTTTSEQIWHRLQYFDRATARQQQRNASAQAALPATRGWTREALYDRDRPR